MTVHFARPVHRWMYLLDLAALFHLNGALEGALKCRGPRSLESLTCCSLVPGERGRPAILLATLL
jgi:hypothetical protein